MKGTIKTYIPEKQYGFIKGEDGKDYFFHNSALKNKNDKNKLSDGLYLEFKQNYSHKGNSALQIELVEDNNVKFQIPGTIYTSKTKKVKGWNTIHISDWIIHGSSEHSPDDAMDEMKEKAKITGANSLLKIKYYKTTDSKPGTGTGTYYFTIHNYVGQAANIGMKNSQGKYTSEELKKINNTAESLKLYLVKQSDIAKRKRMFRWLFIFFLITGLWVFNNDFTIIATIVLLGLAYILKDVTDYDSWLIKANLVD